MGFTFDFNLAGFDIRTVDRLLRREYVERVTLSLKVICIAFCIVLFTLTIKRIIEETLTGAAAVYALKNEIRARLAEIPTSQRLTEIKADYSRISKDSIFGRIGYTEPPPYVPAPVATKKITPLVLVGTFIADEENPYAIIDVKNSQEVYGVGDMILNEARVLRIFEDSVEILRDGQRELLHLDDTSESPSGSNVDAIVVDERELDRALENLPLLLTQARAVPYFKDGQSIGLRLFAIKSGSLFEKIGLMNGDILKAVNGNSLGDITQAVKLFEKLKEQRTITVDLERQREEKTLRYQIR